MNQGITKLAALAIRLEEQGERFYRRSAERTSSEAAKEIFRRLSEEERIHAEMFRRIFGPEADAVKPAAEDVAYLRAVLGQGLFEGVEGGDPPENPRDALAMGIQAEKDSILLYQEMYDRAETADEREALGRLLKEEKFHLIELRESLDDLGYSG